jgi:hypothetical protein
MDIRLFNSRVVAFLALFLLAGAAEALACAVCYGAPGDPMTKGMNLAILTLLGVTAGVLAGFVAFFVYLMKRSRMAFEAGSDPAISAR